MIPLGLLGADGGSRVTTGAANSQGRAAKVKLTRRRQTETKPSGTDRAAQDLPLPLQPSGLRETKRATAVSQSIQ